MCDDQDLPDLLCLFLLPKFLCFKPGSPCGAVMAACCASCDRAQAGPSGTRTLLPELSVRDQNPQLAAVPSSQGFSKEAARDELIAGALQGPRAANTHSTGQRVLEGVVTVCGKLFRNSVFIF